MKSWTGSWSKRFPRAIHRKSRAPLQQGEMGSGKETFPIRLGRWASASRLCSWKRLVAQTGGANQNEKHARFKGRYHGDDRDLVELERYRTVFGAHRDAICGARLS